MPSQGRFPGHMAAAKWHLAYLIGCSNLSCLLIQTPSSKNENASLAPKMTGRKILFSCHVSSAVMFCQDCSKNDLVLLHSECTDPAYQVLISRGFFDLFSKPAGTCSSCHMAFSKGKSLLMSSGFWSNPLTRKSFILWEMPNLCPGRQRSLALSSLPPPRRPKASAISCKHTC